MSACKVLINFIFLITYYEFQATYKGSSNERNTGSMIGWLIEQIWSNEIFQSISGAMKFDQSLNWILNQDCRHCQQSLSVVIQSQNLIGLNYLAIRSSHLVAITFWLSHRCSIQHELASRSAFSLDHLAAHRILTCSDIETNKEREKS